MIHKTAESHALCRFWLKLFVADRPEVAKRRHGETGPYKGSHKNKENSHGGRLRTIPTCRGDHWSSVSLVLNRSWWRELHIGIYKNP